MFWLDDTAPTAPILKMRNHANSGWVTILSNTEVTGGGILTGGMIVAHTVATQSATFTLTILTTCHTATDILEVYLVNELGVAADGANKWVFQVDNVTDTLNLLSAAKDTSAAAITANAQYALGVNQNNTGLATGKVIRITGTKTGAPNNLQELHIAIKLRVTAL